MKNKTLLPTLVAGALSASCAMACTGISFEARDGAHIMARTIEAHEFKLDSRYGIFPPNMQFQAQTPSGKTGMVFKNKYGFVGLTVQENTFTVEGLNEAGLSAGLFFFPDYGRYVTYNPANNAKTIADMEVVTWILGQFKTVDEVRDAIRHIDVVGIFPNTGTVHYRVGDTSGKQIVIEIVNGEVQVFDNPLGVLTNSPGFEWHMTNLNNYLHLQPGQVPEQHWGNVVLKAIGTGAGLKALPGDPTPPSRFIRAAFYKATAPVRDTARETVVQTFSILNAFDIPTGIEHAPGKAPPELISDTQWTAVTDLTNRKIYYRTSWNTTIRMIDLKAINFGRVKYQNHPLDTVTEQPIEKIEIR